MVEAESSVTDVKVNYSEEVKKVSDVEVDYSTERGVSKVGNSEPIYNGNILFYYIALGLLGIMGLIALGAIIYISVVSVQAQKPVDIPDVLVSIVSAIIGAVAGLFAKK